MGDGQAPARRPIPPLWCKAVPASCTWVQAEGLDRAALRCQAPAQLARKEHVGKLAVAVAARGSEDWGS